MNMASFAQTNGTLNRYVSLYVGLHRFCRVEWLSREVGKETHDPNTQHSDPRRGGDRSLTLEWYT